MIMRYGLFVVSSLVFLIGCVPEERIVVRDSPQPAKEVDVDQTRRNAAEAALAAAERRIVELDEVGGLKSNARVINKLSTVVGSFPETLARTEVYVFESDFAHAFTYGKRTILLSDKMVELMSGPGELEFVLAHELAHIEKQHNVVREAVRIFERNQKDVTNASLQESVDNMKLNDLFRRVYLNTEVSADQLAVRRLRNAPVGSCSGAPLLALQKLNPFYPRNGYGLLLNGLTSEIKAWTNGGARRGHPAVARRIAELRIAIDDACNDSESDDGQ